MGNCGVSQIITRVEFILTNSMKDTRLEETILRFVV